MFVERAGGRQLNTAEKASLPALPHGDPSGPKATLETRPAALTRSEPKPVQGQLSGIGTGFWKSYDLDSWAERNWRILSTEGFRTRKTVIPRRIYQSRVAKSQRGFTLIELLAVMAIIALLVGIIFIAVASRKEAGIEAQVKQDALQVRTAATDHFRSRPESGVQTRHTVSSTAELTTVAGESAEAATTALVTGAVQAISSRWPELFITTGASSTFPARYPEVFTTSDSVTSGVVNRVILLDKDGRTIDGKSLLERFTAIDAALLVREGFLFSKPESAEGTTEGVTGARFPNFLWLFEKRTSAATGADNDSREVAVFKLLTVDQAESFGLPATQVDLIYRRLF